MLEFVHRIGYNSIVLSAGVMELVDVTDSKSVGLILRVGSSPTTGTKSSIHNGLELWILDFLYQHGITAYGGA